MRCRVCAGSLEARVTDLPFKIGDTSIVVVRSLPVFQCPQCGETELDDSVMARVEEFLCRVSPSSELEVVRYAA